MNVQAAANGWTTEDAAAVERAAVEWNNAQQRFVNIGMMNVYGKDAAERLQQSLQWVQAQAEAFNANSRLQDAIARANARKP